MKNYVEHVLTFTTQADADNVFAIPLDTLGGPMTLVSSTSHLSAVAGSPTAVTVDIDLTDGTTTKAAVAAQSIGTAAGTTRQTPTAAVQEAGDHNVPEIDDDDAIWRAQVDFNFTGGSTPTVTGAIVLRFAV